MKSCAVLGLKCAKYGSIFCLIILAVFVGLLLLFHPNEYRQQLCQQVSQHTGMDCQIAHISYSIYSPFTLSLEQLQLSQSAQVLAKVANISLALGSVNPFSRKIEIESVTIEHALFTLNSDNLAHLIQQWPTSSNDRDPALPATTESSPLILAGLVISRIGLTDINLLWQDALEPIEINQLDLSLAPWSIIEHHQLNAKQWLFDGKIAVNQLLTSYFPISNLDLQLKFSLQPLLLDIPSLQASLLDGQLNARLSLDIDNMALDLQELSLQGLKVEARPEWFESHSPNENSQQDSTQEAKAAANLPFSKVHIGKFSLKNVDFQSNLPQFPLNIKQLNLALADVFPIEQHQLIGLPFQADQALNFALSAAELAYQEHVVEELDLELALLGNILEVSRFNARLFHGELQSALSFDLAAMALNIHQLAVQNIQVTAEPDWFSAKTQATNPSNNKEVGALLPISSVNIEQASVKNLSFHSELLQLPLNIDALDLSLSAFKPIQQHRLLNLPYQANEPATLSLAAKNIHYQQYNLAQVKLSLSLLAQQLNVAQLDASLFAGQLKSQFELDLATMGLRVNKLAIADMQLKADPTWFSSSQQSAVISSDSVSEPKGKKSTGEAESKPLFLSVLDLERLSLNNVSFSSDLQQLPLNIKHLNLVLEDIKPIQDSQLMDFSYAVKKPIKLSLSAAAIEYREHKVTQIKLKLSLLRHLLTVDQLNANLFDGSLAAKLKFDLALRSLDIQDLTLKNMQINADPSWFKQGEPSSPVAETKAQEQSRETKVIPLPISTLHIAQVALINMNFISALPQLPLNIARLQVHAANIDPIKNYQLISLPYIAKDPSELSLSATSVRYQEHEINELNVAVSLLNAQLDIQQLSGKLLEGELELSAQLLLQEYPELVVNKLNINNIHLSLLPEWLGKNTANTEASSADKLSSESIENIAALDQTARQSLLPLSRLIINDVNIKGFYLDSNSEQLPLKVNDLNLSLHGAELITERQWLQLPMQWSHARLNSSWQEIDYSGYKVRDLLLDSSFTDKKITIQSFRAQLPLAKLSGSGDIALNHPELPARLDLMVEKLDLNEINQLTPDPAFPLGGLITIKTRLFSKLIHPEKVLERLSGSVNVQGENLFIKNILIDDIIGHLLDIQQFGTRNIVSILTLGPIGLLYSQASSLGSTIFGVGSGQTDITKLNLNIAINQGQADVSYSALSTEKFLIAATGKLNIPRQEFNKLHIAVVNSNGCAELIQTIDGPFFKPEIGLLNTILGTALSPVTNLFYKTLSVLGKKCDVFYQGDVAYPPKGRKGLLTQISDKVEQEFHFLEDKDK